MRRIHAFLFASLCGVLLFSSQAFSESLVVFVPVSVNDFRQEEFLDVARVPMYGQTLSIDFLFAGGPALVPSGSTVWSELILQTGPNSSPDEANGDYPYNQYVVFAEGSSAYLLDDRGFLIDAPMKNAVGGVTGAPAPTLRVLTTPRGLAGADMSAFLAAGIRISGIHYDLVLPNTGEVLYLGRFGVKLSGKVTDTPPRSGDSTPPILVVQDPPVSQFPPTSGNPNGDGEGQIPPSDGPQNPLPPIDTADRTAPLLSSISAVAEQQSQTSIRWQTDEAADSQVEYGFTANYGSATPVDAMMVTFHSVTISALPNTLYHYRVKSVDASGNVAVSPDSVFLIPLAIPANEDLPKTTYRHIVATGAGPTPQGLAIISQQRNGVAVSELAIPASRPIRSGRIHVEINAGTGVNTAVTLVNPGPQDAAISFEFRDWLGILFRSGSLTLPGIDSCTSGEVCNQLSQFLDQDPFLGGSTIQGTFTFHSSMPIAVAALRGFHNERVFRDFLMTRLPVVDLSQTASTEAQVLPYIVYGGGVTSQIVLVNPMGYPLIGTLSLLGASGLPKIADINGVSATYASYSIAPNSSTRLVVTSASILDSGYVRVVPAEGLAAPASFVIFSSKPGSVTISEASVPATTGSDFKLYAEMSPWPRIQTGTSIANATGTSGIAILSLTGMDGSLVATKVLPLSPYGQVSAFLDEFIPELADSRVRGILRITTDLPNISVVGLRGRYDEQQQPPVFLVTTIEPSVANDADFDDRFFPLIVNGGGFTTELIPYGE